MMQTSILVLKPPSHLKQQWSGSGSYRTNRARRQRNSETFKKPVFSRQWCREEPPWASPWARDSRRRGGWSSKEAPMLIFKELRSRQGGRRHSKISQSEGEGCWCVSDSFANPWAPLPMRFPRQEYWSRLPFPPPEDLPNPGTEPASPPLTGVFFTTEGLF